ncbi:MAG: SMP-30/gluconolactonase/LRE family protein [Deltaproteobacteria bacterium]|nr:SMP-30/gluconolactonase/LRE family protein [Deltaproteobacteria bacterium]
MKTTLKKILLTLAVPVILYGCAGAPLPDLYWPEPPDVPRIKYIRDYRGGNDFKSGSGAADILLGAEGGAVLKKPMSVHVSGDGKIFVTDTAASDVFLWDPEKLTATTLASMGAKLFYKPIGVATDDNGRIFITDSQTDKVTVLSKTGAIEATLQPQVPFKQPTGIAADKVRKKLYVTDTHNHYIVVFDLDTLKYIKTIGKRGKEEGDFNFPSHIAVGPKGYLYVSDTMNGRIQIFDADGKFVRAFGQFGDSPGMFARPKGVGVDSEGHIYVVDSAFNNVQIFDEEGQILMAFASYGSDRGQMVLPAGIAIDQNDFVYVVDSWNRRVEVFEYLGEKYKARLAAAGTNKDKDKSKK